MKTKNIFKNEIINLTVQEFCAMCVRKLNIIQEKKTHGSLFSFYNLYRLYRVYEQETGKQRDTTQWSVSRHRLQFYYFMLLPMHMCLSSSRFTAVQMLDLFLSKDWDGFQWETKRLQGALEVGLRETVSLSRQHVVQRQKPRNWPSVFATCCSVVAVLFFGALIRAFLFCDKDFWGESQQLLAGK